MLLISWNIWSNNQDQIKSLQTILAFNPVVLCLQEVQEPTIQFLKDLGTFHIDIALDYRRSRNGKTTPFYLVIATKPPIEHSDKIAVEHLTHRSLYDRVLGWEESFEFPFVNITVFGQNFRIFNAHLECACGPSLRLRQFESIYAQYDDNATNILCGDFNTFAHPLVNLLVGWAFNYQLNEYLMHEHTLFAKRFEALQLNNPYVGQITYPRFRMQLDYIVIPNNLRYTKAHVGSQLHGSDHLPLFIELDIQP